MPLPRKQPVSPTERKYQDSRPPDSDEVNQSTGVSDTHQ